MDNNANLVAAYLMRYLLNGHFTAHDTKLTLELLIGFAPTETSFEEKWSSIDTVASSTVCTLLDPID